MGNGTQIAADRPPIAADQLKNLRSACPDLAHLHSIQRR
jgi:hypothetical protein